MKLLLVEDSEALQRSLGAGLRNSGFAVDQALDGETADHFLATNGYDVVVLDVMVPKLDGLQLLARLRARGDRTSVLVLSARDTTEDRIRGLDLGADDYLVKPFSFDELISRLNALIRRTRGVEQAVGATMTVGDLVLDTTRRHVEYEGRGVTLTPSEYGILELLLRRRGQLFSHDQLIDRLYEAEKTVTRNAVEAHVSTLRKKLKEAGVPELVQNRRGFGYYVDA